MKKVEKTEDQLRSYPPLVFGVKQGFKRNLAKISEGKAFLLQGGDCAESFDDFNADYTKRYIQSIIANVRYINSCR